MTTAATWLMVLLSLAGPAPDNEAPLLRMQRLDTISTAVKAIKTPERWTLNRSALEAMTLATAYEESGRYHREVHSGKRRGDKGRSVCLGQIMSGGEELVGVELPATTRCLQRTADILALHAKGCGVRKATVSQLASMATGYGTGYTCRAGKRKWAWRRAALAVRLLEVVTR